MLCSSCLLFCRGWHRLHLYLLACCFHIIEVVVAEVGCSNYADSWQSPAIALRYMWNFVVLLATRSPTRFIVWQLHNFEGCPAVSWFPESLPAMLFCFRILRVCVDLRWAPAVRAYTSLGHVSIVSLKAELDTHAAPEIEARNYTTDCNSGERQFPAPRHGASSQPLRTIRCLFAKVPAASGPAVSVGLERRPSRQVQFKGDQWCPS